MPRPIVMLSDFGVRDPYVGIVKSVIADIAPGSRCIDLTHHVPPQDVEAGSFALRAALPYLPHDSVVFAVVDPGVGTSRAAVAVEGRTPEPADGRGAGGARRLTFIAPDNGILTESLADLEDVVVARLDDGRFHLPSPGATFHGRDVFGPAAAHAARGVQVGTMGTPLDPARLVRFSPPRPYRLEDGWMGTIRWVDRFGDLVTDLPGDVLDGAAWEVRAGDAVIPEISHTFGAVREGEGVAYVGSWGTLEVAIRGGDAAERWGLGTGDRVSLLPR